MKADKKHVRKNIRSYIDPFRILTAPVDIQSPEYFGVTVYLDLVVSRLAHNPEERVREALCQELPPAQQVSAFRSSLSYGELYGVVASLDFVRKIRRFSLECGGQMIYSGIYRVPPGGILYHKESQIIFSRE